MRDVGSTPQFEAPVLAELCTKLVQRARWAAEEPLAVDAETWQKARDEMVEVQKRRGFTVLGADIKQPNFLLMGVPVVVSDDCA